MARWREFERTQVDPNLTKMNAIVQHLHELAATSIRTDQLQAEYVSRRNAGITFAEEPDIFPCNNLPFRRNEKFYGRERTIKAIDEYLRPEVNKILRTYTIYGRRGVGKTNIALEYAHVNPSKFDAIFWIGCETAASLRIAFTQMALKLKLGGATATTHHDENLMLVHNWLKRTEKLWLLIFDNAEDDDLLR